MIGPRTDRRGRCFAGFKTTARVPKSASVTRPRQRGGRPPPVAGAVKAGGFQPGCDRSSWWRQMAQPREVVDSEAIRCPTRGPEVMRPHRDHGRGQLGRIVQQRPLGETQIGQADGAEPRPVNQGCSRNRAAVSAVGISVTMGSTATGPERPAHAPAARRDNRGRRKSGKHRENGNRRPYKRTSRCRRSCDVAGLRSGRPPDSSRIRTRA